MSESWDDEVGGGVASMSLEGVANPGENHSGSFGRGQWFDSSKEPKPGGFGNGSGNNGAINNEWPPSAGSYNGNQNDSFGQRQSGGFGQSERRDNDRNGYRGGGRDGGGGRRFGGEGGGGGGFNRDENGGGGRRQRGGGGGFNRDTNGGDRGGGRSFGGGGSSYNRDSNDGFGGDRGGGRGGGGGRYNRDSNDDNGRGSWNNRDSSDRGGRDGRGGDRGSFRDDGNNDSSSGFGGGDIDQDGGQRGRGGGGFGGRGGGRGGFSGDNDGQDRQEGEEQRPPRYIPPKAPEDEESIFATIKSGINFSKYNDIEVRVTGDNVPPFIHSFEGSGLRQFLIQNVKKATYTTPTPVQKYAIPIIAAKRDLMACAQTGSGKTAAFLLPMLDDIMENPESASFKEVQEPYALIVAPTRELAIQIHTEALKFAFGSVIKCVVAYGGVSVGYCLQQVLSGCHILVGTPGRLLDILNRGVITFAKLRYFVLDEADRLLDKQFSLDVAKMIGHPSMPPKSQKQTLLFSATFEEDVQTFAKGILENYLFLAVGKIGGANVDVEQNFLKVAKFEKKNKLLEILVEGEKVLVFIERKRNADFVASILSQKGFPTTSIHGDRFQAQREEALRDFRTGKMMALVATSLASRGLDINEVAHVVNYDLPSEIDDYIHRIGRTGRVGNPGKATSFYDPETDQHMASNLVRILKDAQKPVPDWLEDEAGNATSSSRGYGGGRFASRDIRNTSDYNGGGSRSTHDHWDGHTASVPAGGMEEESWDC